MPHPAHAAVESHGSAATLYLHGPLDRAAVAPTIVLLRALPHLVRALRLDLRAITTFDGPAIDALLDVIEGWRASRSGATRIVPLLPTAARRASLSGRDAAPTARARDAFVALP